MHLVFWDNFIQVYKLHKNITIIKVSHFSEFKHPLTNIVDYWTILFWQKICDSPASIYLLKVSNRNTRTMYGICSELTMTPEQGYWHCYSAFFCQLWAHFTNGSSVSNVNFEQLNADWKSIFYFKALTIFFICNLAVPWPTLGHYLEGPLIHLMLITAFLYIFNPKVTWSIIARLGS